MWRALVGHTALRNNQMDRLDRAATELKIEAMRGAIERGARRRRAGVEHGAGVSFGECGDDGGSGGSWRGRWRAAGAVYTTHMRTETEAILDAMRGGVCDSAAETCAGDCFASEVRGHRQLGAKRRSAAGAGDGACGAADAGCDCYPYAAGSSTLDLRQVDERVKITITWSTPHPEMAGQTLAADCAGVGRDATGGGAAACSRPAPFITASTKRTCAEFWRIRRR